MVHVPARSQTLGAKTQADEAMCKKHTFDADELEISKDYTKDRSRFNNCSFLDKGWTKARHRAGEVSQVQEILP